MTISRTPLRLCVVFALLGVMAGSVQSEPVTSAVEGLTVPVGLLGQPDGYDDGFILPDEPDSFSAPATPPTTQTPGAGAPMAAAREFAYTLCLLSEETPENCNAKADAAGAEIVQKCQVDPGRCCAELNPSFAEQLLGAPGACGH